ncbi:MAG: hypothetical protein ACNA8W_12940, partial [Bradymonadaceae bacterium]
MAGGFITTSHPILIACFLGVVGISGIGCERLPFSSGGASMPVSGPSSNPTAQPELKAPTGPLQPLGELQEANLRPLPAGIIDGDTIRAVGFG